MSFMFETPSAEDDEFDAIEAQDPAVEEAAFDLMHHADGTPKMVTIRRINGSGEREIPAIRWPEFSGNGIGAQWQIVRTEVVGRGHSEGL